MSWCCASIGRGSQTEIPATLVGIVPNSPRTSTGASGFGSKLSMWLIPPWSQRRMHETSLPDVVAAAALARRNAGSVSPRAVNDPTRRKLQSRRSRHEAPVRPLPPAPNIANPLEALRPIAADVDGYRASFGGKFNIESLPDASRVRFYRIPRLRPRVERGEGCWRAWYCVGLERHSRTESRRSAESI